MREPFRKFIKSEIKDGFLLIACGLPGTWKTETTEEAYKIKGGRLLRTDIIRLEVLKNQDIFDAKVAGDMKKRTQVYDVMFEQAGEAFKGNKKVILAPIWRTYIDRVRFFEGRFMRRLEVEPDAAPAGRGMNAPSNPPGGAGLRPRAL